jgi:hypothetical protein
MGGIETGTVCVLYLTPCLLDGSARFGIHLCEMKRLASRLEIFGDAE